MARKKAEPTKTFFCCRCGKVHPRGTGFFYKSPNSELYSGNDNYTHICSECVRELFEKEKKKYGSQKLAAIIMCYRLDLYFCHSLYEAISMKNENFNMGIFTRMLNGTQYKDKTFATTLAEGELSKDIQESIRESEVHWTLEDRRAKNEVIKMLGHDPFEGYHPRDRKYLFSEFLQYLDDDELLDDQYKVSQLIQLINNNNQINQYDIALSRLDPIKDIDEVESLNKLKKDLVMSNDRIAAQNGFSSKSRGDKKAGKGTLTNLMREMRERDIKGYESNFYDQLQSANSRWAADVSFKSLKTNCYFDENDINDIIDEQRKLIDDLQTKLDTNKEDLRLSRVEHDKDTERIKELEEQVTALGGKLEDDLSEEDEVESNE